MPDVVAASSAAADAANAIVNFFNTGISSIVTICFSYSTDSGFTEPFESLGLLANRSATPCGDTGRGQRFCPEILCKARLRTRQMLAHRQACGLGIARDNGIANRAMLGQRGDPRLRVLEIMREF